MMMDDAVTDALSIAWVGLCVGSDFVKRSSSVKCEYRRLKLGIICK